MSGGDPLVTIVDAFTTTPFAGNPAAVCTLASPREPAWMQALARELRLPATCFVTEVTDGYGLRWFAPATELALCGHGTLAAAHVVFARHPSATATVRFHSLAGVLECRRQDDWIVMDFPAEPPTPEPSPPAALLTALEVAPRNVARNRYDYLVELATAGEVRACQPDVAQLLQVDTRGVIVTALADGPDDFVSRFFAVVAGGDEDAVTGSAHCALGPYWGERLGKTELAGWQASARGGRVRVRLRDDRVELLGQAVTILQGVIQA
jgi:PhzF family phenazine biosynthesis protein